MSSREKTHTCLLVLRAFLSAAECAGFHSLGFLSTGRFPPGTGPDFEQVTVFDGVLISHCDSRTPQEQFKAVLESHNLIRTCEEAQYDVYDALREVSKFINSTLYVQRRRGCTRSAEGLTSAFEIWAVNGEDFIQFDADHQEWEALADTALTIRDSWNNQETRNHVFGSFLKDQCPEMIQRIKLKEVEQKTDLRVFATPIDRFRTLLKCHVTSTDKSLGSLSLTEDGASRALWVAVRGPLPSVDGSVVLRLTAEVLLGSSNIYGCVVPTGGGTITVMWDGKTLDGRHIFYASIYWISLYILVFIVFALVLQVCAIRRWYCFKSRRERRRLYLKNTNKNEPLIDTIFNSLIQDLYTLRDRQNEDINSLIQRLYRDPQNVEMESLIQRLYTHRDRQTEEIKSLIRDLYTRRDPQNVEMEPFSPDSNPFRDLQTDRKWPSCGSSFSYQTGPQLHLGIRRNSV